MSDYESQVVRANDARAGRTIPPWKYWTLFLVTVLAFTVIKGFADVNVICAVAALVWGTAYVKLIGPYKAREIR